MKGSRTQGAVDLARLGVTQQEIATRLRRSRAAVGHWMTGRRRPGGDERTALEREFGIPAPHWEAAIGSVALLRS